MGEFDNLHQILLSLYEEMMPLCSDMAGVAKGLAGLGALFYVAMRVWQSLARAEAIDLSLIHISEPTRPLNSSRMPSSA